MRHWHTEDKIAVSVLALFGVFIVGLVVYAITHPEGPCVEGSPTPIVSMVGKVPVTNYYCLHSEHRRVGFYCKCPVATQVGDGGVMLR